LYVPTGRPRGAVLATTGFSEHVGRYEHVCRRWQAAGWLVANWDLRGQGHSEGARGYIDRFSEYVDDLFAFADQLQQTDAWRDAGPPVLFGHSTGGLISIHAALRSPERVRALALTSPYLGLALKTPAWKLWMGRMIASAWPSFSLPTGVAAGILTHDLERAKAIDEDPLSVRRMTARLFNEIEAAQSFATSHARELTLPISCRAAGLDQLVDLNVTRRFMKDVGSKDSKLVVAETAFHELHQELGWEQHSDAFLEDFARWV
jgi:alpha-beta hydrolase superfamily lysophospholipase